MHFLITKPNEKNSNTTIYFHISSCVFVVCVSCWFYVWGLFFACPATRLCFSTMCKLCFLSLSCVCCVRGLCVSYVCHVPVNLMSYVCPFFVLWSSCQLPVCVLRVTCFWFERLFTGRFTLFL